MKGGRKNSGRKNEPEQWPALSDDWDTERGKANFNPDLRFEVDYPLEFPRIGGWKTQKPAEASWAVGGKVGQNYAIVMNVEII
jgi:hypothetical protein